MFRGAKNTTIEPRRETSSGSEYLPLSVHDLVYSAQGKKLIDIKNLQISTGGPSLILGPNGAGKSLLLRLFHGLIEPTSGHVLFGGQTANNAIRQHQSMVFQRPVILRRRVAENVHYPLKARRMAHDERREKVAQMLGSANMTAKASQPARSLSGGEQQLLALIRALATDPEILFLDEPTSSLDPGATQLIETMISQASVSGTKIIMVSHDLGQAKRLAQEVLFCHHGRIIEQTSATKFFETAQSDVARQFVAGALVL